MPIERFSSIDLCEAATYPCSNIIYSTYGRFPAHVDAIHVPGIWLQAHHLDLDYYNELFQDGFIPEIHRKHQENWHG
jgi:hypothetical protein